MKAPYTFLVYGVFAANYKKCYKLYSRVDTTMIFVYMYFPFYSITTFINRDFHMLYACGISIAKIVYLSNIIDNEIRKYHILYSA